ncbi:uncharacterized protein LOC107039513 [Diachasma alloeum]|uniref:uncharacterized protein LOC107039513 n=1 Tax=Diachasma alloeum TaxID=454923 RepID=UPI0007381839|nr:uncharacterized protein LOC107039513 [Diachasma alloeum]
MGKKKEKILLFLVFGLILRQHLVMGFIPGLAFVYDVLDKMNAIHDVHSKLSTPSSADLMEATEKLSGKIDKLGPQIMEHIDRAVEALLTRLPLLGEITGDVRLLNSYIGRIDTFYNEMKLYLNHSEWYTEKDLRELLTLFISHDSGKVSDVIAQLNFLVVPHRLAAMKESLFLLLGEETKGRGGEMCDTYGPPQQRLLDLYDIILETEMRSFLMTTFGYIMQDFLDKENSTGGLKRAESSYMHRVQRYEAAVRQGMKKSSRTFRRCDPPNWVRDESFYEMKSFSPPKPLYGVNLRPMEADTDRNMIVTGIAFTRKSSLLALRVEVAELKASGYILNETAVWLEPEDIGFDSGKSQFFLMDDESTKLATDKDVSVLSLSYKRIHLDKVTLPPDEVVTGVRFTRRGNDHGKPIQLEIRSTRVDYDKGILYSDSNKWIQPKEPVYVNGERRAEYKETDFRGPQNNMMTSIDAEPMSFIDFDWSQTSWDGYTTAVPLLDGVPVIADPRTPLAGIAIYHKKAAGYSGFLTFVLEGFDKSNYNIDVGANPF